MKKFLLIALIGVASCALAADGATLYLKCKACHGAKAELKYLNKIPALSTLKADYMVTAMESYKAGNNNKYKTGILMKGQMAPLSQTDIKTVAEYIANTFGAK